MLTMHTPVMRARRRIDPRRTIQSKTTRAFGRSGLIDSQVDFACCYRRTNRGKENCLPIEAGTSGCTENFVGAVAVVQFTVNRIANGKSAASSIREVVTVLDQSPGLSD